MTRNEIRNWMINRISETLENEFCDDEEIILKHIDEETLNDFMWGKDFGLELAEQYIEENITELADAYLETIYQDISTDDLDSPW